MTVKNEDEYKRLSQSVHVDGAVSSSGASFLQGVTFADLQKSGGKASEGATDRNYPLGFYGTDVVATNRQVYLHGVGMAWPSRCQARRPGMHSSVSTRCLWNGCHAGCISPQW